MSENPDAGWIKAWQASGLSMTDFVAKIPQALPPPEKPKIRGLGDVIATVTKAVGIQPCGGCQKRQEFLNKIVPL